MEFITVRDKVNAEESETLPPIGEELISKLMANSDFDFELDVHREHFIRNSLFLVLFGIIAGGILGTIFYFILEYTNIINQYAILGIGAGVGLAFGIVIGICLIIALKAQIVPDFGSSYGIGFGTNIFIGAVIGMVTGAIIGSLFGLILKATGYIIYTDLSYPVYGMLIWIVLGLNIGVLIGLITSFGSIDIIVGGAIAGCIVGPLGSLAIFGPNWIVVGGVAVGLVVGAVIGVFSKYSIRASMGSISQPLCNPSELGDKIKNDIDESIRKSTRRRRRSRYYNRYSNSCFGPTYTTSYACHDSDDSDDCGGDRDGGGSCAQALVPLILLILLAGVVIVLISFISWVSVKASTKFGGVVKKGALTAFGSSASILLIIGCNIGLTASFHNLEIYYLIIIGASIAMLIGLLLFGGQALSIKSTSLNITPRTLKWKDGTSQGLINFYNVESYNFVVLLDDQENVPEYDGHIKLNLSNGTSRKVHISCWKTPGKTGSSRYLQTILQHYLVQVAEIKVQQKARSDKIKSTTILQESDKPRRRTYRESIEDGKIQAREKRETELRKRVSEKEINAIKDLVDDRDKMSANWISRVTQIPENRVIDIATMILDKEYKNGFIVSAKQLEKSKVRTKFSKKQIHKVKDIVDARKKISVAYLSKVTGLTKNQVIKIATEHLDKLVVKGYIISNDIFE